VDSVEIHTDIVTYLGHIEDCKRYELHYTPPPEEDIQAFSYLDDLIVGMSDLHLEQGQGNTGFAKLISLVDHTATGREMMENKKITFDGKSGTSHLTKIDPHLFTFGLGLK
jgi:hypothetical protein